MKRSVLLVDDEKSIVDAISYAMGREGYLVDTALNGEEALKKIRASKPGVVILDVMMPKLSGLELCRVLDTTDNLGIILLTARDDIVDKVLGLELGADDYLTKPFDMRELLARVRSLFRRMEKEAVGEQMDTVEIGKLKIYSAQRKAVLSGQQMELTLKEFDLLVQLLSHPERVYTREQLLELIWEMEYQGGTRTVDIHIQRLRKKLGEPYHLLIQTVYGVGYKGLGGINED